MSTGIASVCSPRGSLDLRSWPYRFVGSHVLADISGSLSPLLSDGAALEALPRRASESAGATVLTAHHGAFEPLGVTAIVVLAESHVSIHTWPEWGGATIDAHPCGAAGHEQLVRIIVTELAPSTVRSAISAIGRLTSMTNSTASALH